MSNKCEWNYRGKTFNYLHENEKEKSCIKDISRTPYLALYNRAGQALCALS